MCNGGCTEGSAVCALEDMGGAISVMEGKDAGYFWWHCQMFPA